MERIEPLVSQVRRLGVTMRIVEAINYDEARDALAHDWGRFLRAALPEVAWMPIPNIGIDAVSAAQHWGLDGLIMSGGDNIGETAARDETELHLLNHAVQNGLPVFGVCRGLQMMQVFMQGSLTSCSSARHVGKRHRIELSDRAVDYGLNSSVATVNSYHGLGITSDDLANGLEMLARSDDGFVEAAGCFGPGPKGGFHRFLGVMWHPEREHEPVAEDVDLLRRWLGYKPVVGLAGSISSIGSV